ncbi:hypothetical protein D3C85_1225150 [compost metagenome]
MNRLEKVFRYLLHRAFVQPLDYAYTSYGLTQRWILQHREEGADGLSALLLQRTIPSEGHLIRR